MRAVVEYDHSLPDTDYTGVETPSGAAAFRLSQNYPNPVAGTTAIDFSLAESGYATLAVYDMLGRQVAVLADGWMEYGTHGAEFNSANYRLSPGLYIIRLRQGANVLTRNMLLMQ
jgi:hypothetical protein